MKTLIILLSVCIILGACTTTKLKYPVTRKTDTVDVYFGTKVPDPYRWLENDNSEETKTWVKAENEVTFNYLQQIPFREKVKNRLFQIWNFERVYNLQKKSGLYIFEKNNGLQNQNVYYYASSKKDPGKILLDPNLISKDGTSAVHGMAISTDHKYLAYGISKSGSDWVTVYFREIETGKQLQDSLNWVRFSNLSWNKDGIFYSRYDEPKKGNALTQQAQYQKLYFHKLHSTQNEDQLILNDDKDPIKMFDAEVSSDGHFLIVTESRWGFDGNRILVKDLLAPKSQFIGIGKDYSSEFGLVENHNNLFYLITNYNAPKRKLIVVDINAPDSRNWNDIIPEKDCVLDGVSIYGRDNFICNYLQDAHSKIEKYDLRGKYLEEIVLPSMGTAGLFISNAGDNEVFLTFESFTQPPTSYSYEEGRLSPFSSPKFAINPRDYVTEQEFFVSKDGTKIPMFIVHRKDIKLDGNNPFLLYGYGGFNISETPAFSISRMMWLENGGVYGMVNLRGGGEYGKAWHDAGTKLHKQNVFDDFIAAATFVIHKKYTNPSKLAVLGGSNGGLLIGAVANQRPDLFAVAVPMVGVMDMLRYHKFTIGGSWVTDYGSSDDSIQFNYLLKYSPLHNIKENIEYPAILVTTADHDDRVVPAHSFKYIATLQEKYMGPRPVLIRIQTKAGHGGGKPTAITIVEQTDIYSFIFKNLGVSPK